MTVPEELIVSLVTVASESYPPELLSVNAFRARGAVFGGKLLCRSVALSVEAGDPAQRHRTTPFHDKSFSNRRHGSWPTAGASTSEFPTACHHLRGNGERLPMSFVTEDAGSAAHVKVGSNIWRHARMGHPSELLVSARPDNSDSNGENRES